MDLQDNPGATIGVYSPTYDLLTLNLIPRIESALIEHGYQYQYRKSDNIITIPGIGKIIFRSMDNPSRIVAYECFRSHVDELDLLPLEKAEEVWNRIIARNRQKLPGNPVNRVSGYSTPEGFQFTYKRWKKEQNPEYQYVRAPTTSNYHLQPDYVESLRATYSAQLIEAYLKGIWVNLTSGGCFPEFDRVHNNCDTVDDGREGLLIGQDFNILKMCSVVYVRRGNELHAIDEVVNAFDTAQTVKIIQQRYEGRQITIVPDATGVHRSSSGGTTSDFTLLRAAGFRIDGPHANPRVMNRINATNALICNSNGERRLKVNTRRCPELTAAMEQITFDANGVMDKKTDLDHIIDGMSYVCHRLFPVEHTGAAQVRLLGT